MDKDILFNALSLSGITEDETIQETTSKDSDVFMKKLNSVPSQVIRTNNSIPPEGIKVLKIDKMSADKIIFIKTTKSPQASTHSCSSLKLKNTPVQVIKTPGTHIFPNKVIPSLKVIKTIPSNINKSPIIAKSNFVAGNTASIVRVNGIRQPIKNIVPASTIKDTLDDPTKFVKVKHNGVSKFISTSHVQSINKRPNGISIPVKFYDSKNPITVSKPIGSVLPNGRLFSVVPNSTGLNNNRRRIQTPLNKNSLVSINSRSIIKGNFPIQRLNPAYQVQLKSGKSNGSLLSSGYVNLNSKKITKENCKSVNRQSKKRKKDEPTKPKLLPSQEDEDHEDLQHVFTYEQYIPNKLTIGKNHPDNVVEASSMASIDPPDINHCIIIPMESIETGKLSALQLESIHYACQKHETFLPSGERAGFLIGDGAGVGKGRTISGIIYENYLRGRKRALWFSVSNDLKIDAERDLRDIGAKVKVFALTKFKYGKITHKMNGAVKKGVIFATYSSLISESKDKKNRGKYATRLDQLLHWCGEGFDGVIIFDESHKAKNLQPSGLGRTTKTAATVLKLQKLLPNARVVYASATGASEPRHMAYMSRIGLWGPGSSFNDFACFVQAMDKRGIGSMELVAMDMKLRGSYIARQLSFGGVSFGTEYIRLQPDFIELYDKCAELWQLARAYFFQAAALVEAELNMKKSMWSQFWGSQQRFFKYIAMSAKVDRTVELCNQALKDNKCVVIGIQTTGDARIQDELDKCNGELDDFVSTTRSLFDKLVINHFPAPDRDHITSLFGEDFYKSSSHATSEDAIDDSNSDDESIDKNFMNENYDSEDSERSFGDVMKKCNFYSDSDSECESPVKKRKKRSSSRENESEEEEMKKEPLTAAERRQQKKSNILSNLENVSGTPTSKLPGAGPIEKAQAMKRDLLAKIDSLGRCLPNNVLDELIDRLGGPSKVAELTGRKGRIVSTGDDGVQYEKRSENLVPVDMINLTEKERFMNGEKNIAIISEAASSGISLHADRRSSNHKQRVHITLELPWSADKAIQQFGRTHRSNQVTPPQYVFMITDLAGEQRFAAVVAKRLESLGALTHGDRRAGTVCNFNKFNFDNKYGRKALEIIMKVIAKQEKSIVPLPRVQNFLERSPCPGIRKSCIGVGLMTIEKGQKAYQLDKEYNNIYKFMNRILGMVVELQNAIFTFFADTLTAVIQDAKTSGQFDQGIVDISCEESLVDHLDKNEFELNNTCRVFLHKVKIDRGYKWELAVGLEEKSYGENSGYYISKETDPDNKPSAILALGERNVTMFAEFTIYRPSIGKQFRRVHLDSLQEKYEKCSRDTAEKWWKEQYEASSKMCLHRYSTGECPREDSMRCQIGLRSRVYHILSGSVLSVWKVVEKLLQDKLGPKHKLQVVRLKTSTGGKIVGLLIPHECVFDLVSKLRQSNSNVLSADMPLQTHHYEDVFDDDITNIEEVEDIDPDKVESSVLTPRNLFS